MKQIITDRKQIMRITERLNKLMLEKEFRSKNISDLIKKLKKHKTKEIKDLKKEDLNSCPPYHKEYVNGYIEGLTKCIDVLTLNKTL